MANKKPKLNVDVDKDLLLNAALQRVQELENRAFKQNDEKILNLNSMFNTMSPMAKALLLQDCKDEIFNYFVAVDNSVSETDPILWYQVVDSLTESLESHILEKSGTNWHIKNVGRLNPIINNGKIVSLGIQFAHQARRKPKFYSADSGQNEQPDPNPTTGFLTTKINRQEIMKN